MQLSATNKGTPAEGEKKVFTFEDPEEKKEDEVDPFQRAGTFHGRDASKSLFSTDGR